MTPSPDPTTRFNDRVADYVRYRPDYPPALAQTLCREAGLTAGSRVADIGSGTGISSRLFLGLGCDVFAVEPNRAMRTAAESALAREPGFHSVAGRAEATRLEVRSINLVAAGQAFHWFDRARARKEFQRILVPEGQVALFWNRRRTDMTPFLRAYEQLLHRFATDYDCVRHDHLQASDFDAFFGAGRWRQLTFPHNRRLNWESLRGRLFSSSYTPSEDHPDRVPMESALRRIYERHQVRGNIQMEYDTQLFLGHLEECEAP